MSYTLLNDSIYEKLNNANIPYERQTYTAGALILQHGHISSSIYIIEAGQANVFITQERKVVLATLTEQQFFGEMSCLTGDPISANVEALTDLQLIVLARDGLMLLMDEHPVFRNQLIESMVQRIKNSNDRVLQEHQKNVLMMQLHDEQEQHRYGDLIGESPEIEAVRQAIPKLARERFVIVKGERGTEKLAVARKIHEASESRLYPFVVIDGEKFEMNAFESKVLVAANGTIAIEHAECLQREQLQALTAYKADVTLMLFTIEPLPYLQAATLEIAPLRERLDDVPLLAQSIVNNIDGASQDALSDEAYRLLSLYPYLSNNVKELENVLREAFVLSEGRTIYGKHLKFGRERKPGERPKIGFAFGSGSARGLAHLGVWKEIEAAQIPIDLVAGTSIGSVISGAIAYGLTNAQAVSMMNNLKWSQIVKPTLPVKSIVQNAPLIQLLQSHIGNPLIEDLKLPFGAVAAELTTGEAHIMRSGPLVEAIQASTAIPSIIRPVQFQGKELIDGAVVHPVPVALARSMGADIVVAVNIGKEPSAKGNVRNFMDTLLHTIDIMSSKLVQEELQLADIVIRPDFEGRAIKFKDFDFCFGAGEQATQQHISFLRDELKL